MAKSAQLLAPSRRWKYQAIISGIAIFISSDGWMRVTPRSSQRRAPFEMSPNSATPTSSTTPSRYTGTAVRWIHCNGRFAAIHMMANAIVRFRTWSWSRPS